MVNKSADRVLAGTTGSNSCKGTISMNIYSSQPKHCKVCDTTKSIFDFPKDKSRPDGYSYTCKVCNRIRQKDYRSRVDWAKKNRDFYWKNREKCIADKVQYNRKKLDTDPFFRFKSRIRTAVRASFSRTRKGKKATKTEQILGCSSEFFKTYIEGKFSEGMSWDNMNLWHLDHIIPLAEAKTEEDVIKLCHYTNFQPLWAEDNIRKGAKRI
jgi:hypothetical protein